MKRTLRRRLLQAVFVVWAAYTLAFVILYVLPGDPVSVMLSGAAGDVGFVDEATREQLRAELGLDRPLIVQYGLALLGVLRGDLGTSVSTGIPVTELIASTLPPTVALASASIVIAIVVALGLALAAFLSPSPTLRGILSTLPPAAASAPTFWIGLLLMQVVSFQLGLLPAIGDGDLRHLVLPAITLAVPIAAVLTQVTFKSLETALGEAHIETAKGAGIGTFAIVVRHAGRAAVVAPLTVLGLVVANAVAGAVVVETVFARRGLGRTTATAVTDQDLPVVLGVVLVAAVAFVVVNLVADLLLPLIDPRLRSQKARR